MKTLLFFIGLLIFPNIIFTQIRKDQWLIGGNGSFSYSKNEQFGYISLALSPQIGYFFIDKFAVGLRPGFSLDASNRTYDKFRISTLSLSPYLRYYLIPADQKINLLIDASFGYSWGKNHHFDPESVYRYKLL